MTLYQSIILGIVQGITEFFPISSSAHLRFIKKILAISDGEHLLYFDLVCHAGTLLALILFLRKEIHQAVRDFRSLFLFFIALIPLVPAYFLLKPLRLAASNPAYMGWFLGCTSLLLFWASFQKRDLQRKEEGIKVKDVLCIGIMQTLALIPGISRSGSTIATGRLLGWSWVEAARFSYLLSIPAILGGWVLESIKLFSSLSIQAPPLVTVSCYVAGFSAAFAAGSFGVRWIFRIYQKGNIRPFAWYCMFAAGWAFWSFCA